MIQDMPAAMPPALRAAARTLALDALTAQTVETFRAAGVPSILLKGPSIEAWLYDGQGRDYADCDLLVPADRFAAAGACLSTLGFELELDDEDGYTPDPHAQTWRRRNGLAVDLHRRLHWVRAAPEVVWAELSSGTDRMSVGGAEVAVLGFGARALQVGLHAVSPQLVPGPLRDLERALERVDEQEWRTAAELADRLGASDALATGLRRLPAGTELAVRLGLPSESSAYHTLTVEGRPGSLPYALVRLTELHGVPAKIRFVLRVLFPPKTWMQYGSSRARRGRLGLATAYLVRLARGVLHLPGACLRMRSLDREAPPGESG